MGSLEIVNPATTFIATDARAKILRSLDQLPPFSPVLSQLMASLAEDDVSFGKLAGVIERDTVLSASVLRLVNSVLYGRRGTISSVRHAVAVIGIVKLRNYLFGLSISRMWSKVKTPPGWSMANFNVHSVAAGIMSDVIVQRAPAEYPEGAFVAGLLHDLGRLMIAIGAPIEYATISKDFETTDEPWAEIERRILGFTHAEMSAEALRRWNLPEPIQRAVLEHPGALPSDLTPVPLPIVVQTASRLSDALSYSLSEKETQNFGTVEEIIAASRIPLPIDELTAQFERDFNAMRASIA